MAIAQLLTAQKIGLDDKVGDHLSGFAPEVADQVTVRHLLTMTSGMGDYWNEEWDARWSTIKTVDDLMDLIRKIPLDFEPGSSKQYSNAGYAVLGAIVAAVTGQTYYDYVREHIFEPAGMKDTDSYEMDQIVPNLAIGYTTNRSESPYNGNELQNNLFVHSVKGSPAGGGYSTVDDLVRYAEALRANQLGGPAVSEFTMSPDPDKPARPRAFALAGGAPVGIMNRPGFSGDRFS